jgi:hypothetical protein
MYPQLHDYNGSSAERSDALMADGRLGGRQGEPNPSRDGDRLGVDVDADHASRLADSCRRDPGREAGPAGKVDDAFTHTHGRVIDEVVRPFKHEFGHGSLVALRRSAGDLESGPGRVG